MKALNNYFTYILDDFKLYILFQNSTTAASFMCSEMVQENKGALFLTV